LSDEETTGLIERLPDYRQFDAILQRRRIYISRARNEALPILDVTGGTGYTGYGTGYRNAYDQAFGNDQRDWQALLEMRVPLGFRSERANLAKRKVELQIDDLRRREFEQNLRAQIREAARAVVAANERVHVTDNALDLTTRQYEQLRAKFGEGLAPFREMLLVQDDLQEAGLRALRAQFDAVQARIRLARFDGSLLDRYGFAWSNIEIARY
jgi:outer membrane protein TolC